MARNLLNKNQVPDPFIIEDTGKYLFNIARNIIYLFIHITFINDGDSRFKIGIYLGYFNIT